MIAVTKYFLSALRYKSYDLIEEKKLFLQIIKHSIEQFSGIRVNSKSMREFAVKVLEIVLFLRADYVVGDGVLSFLFNLSYLLF